MSVPPFYMQPPPPVIMPLMGSNYVEFFGLNYIWINSLIRKFLIMLNANMAINGEISIPILNEERRFLIGANIGSVILYSSRIYWFWAL